MLSLQAWFQNIPKIALCGVVYFTIEFERKKKIQGGNYGQIFPKIAHQKIFIVFEMQN